jgi:PAS domain S-box-containing protein
MGKLGRVKIDFRLFAFENINEPVVISDSVGKIYYANSAACRYLQYEKDELEKMQLSDIDVSFSDEGWSQKWVNLKEKKINMVKTIHRTKNGLFVPVEIQARYFEYQNKEFGLSFVRLISEDEVEKNSEKSIGVFDHRLINDHAEPLFLLDEETRIFDVNPAFEKVSQYTRKELINKEFRFCFLSQNLAEHIGGVIFKEGKLSRFPLELKTKKGESVPVLISALVLHDAQNQSIYAIVSARDLTREKETERSLRINDERFRRAQSIGHIGNWEYDIQNDSFWGSEEAKRIYGLDPASEKFSVDEVESCIPNQVEVHQALMDLIEKEKPYVLEFEVTPKDGQPEKIIHSLAELYKDENGIPVAVEGVIQDITEQKRLQEKMDHLAAIVASSDEAIIGKTLDGVITSWNKGAERIYGYSNEEIIGKSVTLLVLEEDMESSANILTDVRNGKCIHHYEAKRRRKDGKVIDVALTVSPILNSMGTITGISTVAHEITQQKMDAAINISRLHLVEYSLNHSLDDLLEETINEVEKLTDSLIGFCHFINEDQQEIPLRNWSTSTKTRYWKAEGKGLHYPVEQAGVWAECLHSRQAEIQNDYKTLPNRKGMPEYHVEVIREMVVPVIRGEKVVAILGVGNKQSNYDQEDVNIMTRIADLVWDIAERKHAEEELHRLNQELEARVYRRTKELENASGELESFTYSVSHDLRAPLRHINGYIELLREQSSQMTDKDCLHYLDVITQSANLMNDLIDDILSFSRVGRIEMNQTNVNMYDLVNKVIVEFQLECQDLKIEWTIEELPTVWGDQTMLHTVMTNLISNALKFTQKREITKIKIGTESLNDGNIPFFVQDNGVGFDMRFVDRLFKVFQRLHRVDEFEGTGIGLANVNQIITRHGGKVWAVGKVGEGATFYFSLPIQGNQENAQPSVGVG